MRGVDETPAVAMTSLSGSLPSHTHLRTLITELQSPPGLENCAVPLRVINEHSALLEGLCLFTALCIDVAISQNAYPGTSYV